MRQRIRPGVGEDVIVDGAVADQAVIQPVPAIHAKGVLKYPLGIAIDTAPLTATWIEPAESIATGIGAVQWAVEEVAIAVITQYCSVSRSG